MGFRFNYIYKDDDDETVMTVLLLDRMQNSADIVDIYHMAQALAGIEGSSFKFCKIEDYIDNPDPNEVKFEHYKLAVKMLQQVQEYKNPDQNRAEAFAKIQADAQQLQLKLESFLWRKHLEKELHPVFNELPITATVDKDLNDVVQKILNINRLHKQLDAQPSRQLDDAIEQAEEEIEKLLASLKQWVADNVSKPAKNSELKEEFGPDDEDDSNESYQFLPSGFGDPPLPLRMLSPTSSPGSASPNRMLVQPWVEFNPFADDKDAKQDSWKLQVEELPVLPTEILQLAIDILNIDPKTPKQNNFKFEKNAESKEGEEIPERNKLRFVKRICELARDRCEQNLGEQFTRARRIEELEDEDKRIFTRIATWKLDKELDEMKTKTIREMDTTTFKATVDCSGRLFLPYKAGKEQVSSEADEFFAKCDKYWNLANQRLGNIIELNNAHAKELFQPGDTSPDFADKLFSTISFVKQPKEPRDYFQLAYAIANQEEKYHEAPVTLIYDEDTWARKSARFYFAWHCLNRIPKDAKLFSGIGSDKDKLIEQIKQLHELTKQFKQQQQQQALLKPLLERLEQDQQQLVEIISDYDNQRIPALKRQKIIEAQLQSGDELASSTKERITTELQDIKVYLQDLEKRFGKKEVIKILKEKVKTNRQQVSELKNVIFDLNVSFEQMRQVRILDQSIREIFGRINQALPAPSDDKNSVVVKATDDDHRPQSPKH